RAVDVNCSDWDCTLEPEGERDAALDGAPSAIPPHPTLRVDLSPAGRGKEDYPQANNHSLSQSTLRSDLSPPRSGEGDRTPNALQDRVHPAHAEMRGAIRSTHAVRLGFRQIKGFSEDNARTIMEHRGEGYDSVR